MGGHVQSIVQTLRDGRPTENTGECILSVFRSVPLSQITRPFLDFFVAYQRTLASWAPEWERLEATDYKTPNECFGIQIYLLFNKNIYLLHYYNNYKIKNDIINLLIIGLIDYILICQDGSKT